MKKPFAFDPSLTLEACFQKWEKLLGSLGIELGSETSRLMNHFLKELKLWNRRVNLVSFHSDEELLLSHLVDSLIALQDPFVQFEKPFRCVDVGAGGGFPGVPLRLARPDWSFTFVESVKKKTSFIEAMIERFPMANCKAVAARSEDLAGDAQHRASYDVAFCRAVGEFSTGLELTLPLLKVGGAWLAHRGFDAPREAEEAAGALARLGGAVASLHRYELPHLDKPRYIVRVEKKSPTPEEFPRRPGMAAKRPL